MTGKKETHPKQSSIPGGKTRTSTSHLGNNPKPESEGVGGEQPLENAAGGAFLRRLCRRTALELYIALARRLGQRERKSRADRQEEEEKS